MYIKDSELLKGGFMDLLQLFKSYLLHEKRYSKNTVDAYIRDTFALSEFLLSINLTLENAEHLDISDYLASLYDTISPTSLHRKIASIRHFYVFLKKRGFIEENPATMLTSPRKGEVLPRQLTKDEMLLLINFNYPDTLLGFRNRAVVEFLYSSGIRVGELVSTNIENLEEWYQGWF